DELRACLHHQAEPMRVMAAAKLIEMGDPEGVAFAARELPDACCETATVLLRAMWWDSDVLRDEQKMSLLGPLIAWMRRHVVGGYVVNVLGTMPAQAIPAITEMLDDPELEVRRDTASILGDIGDRSAVPTLEKLLSDPDGQMRINALGALGEILRADVAPYLDRFLGSNDPDDREAAYMAAYNAEDVGQMAQVFRRIPETCSPTGYDAITATWEPARGFVGSPSPPGAEEREPDRTALDPLVAAARDVFGDPAASRQARLNAAWFILWHDGEVTPPDDEEAWPRTYPPLPASLVPCLTTVLESPDLWWRYGSPHIETEIARVRSPEAVPALAAAMPAENVPRDAVAQALAHIDPEGVKVLLDSLGSGDDDIVRRAAYALLQAGVPAALGPAMDLYRHGRLRLTRDSLTQMDEATAKQAVLDAVVTDPVKVTSDDLRMLKWADEERGLALARAVLQVRTAHSPRRTAISLLRHKGLREDLPLLRRIAGDDLELYWLRYEALRAIEKTRPAEAREIARQWTHDRRFDMRHCGRLLLRGEEM
ncbi:MAG TPA: HEAT repeat domain-containing protein, partial [Armatimonadota bacterium]|nr:HEAT repeat domain-containing protein [Armatimonadota bacterium]